MEALTTLSTAKPRWGFWKYVDRLHNTGHPCNHKRLWRGYCWLRLNLPRRTKKRLPVRVHQPLTVIPQPDTVWGYDYYGTTRTVDVHISRLKLKLPLLDDAIISVQSMGYKLSDQPIAN